MLGDRIDPLAREALERAAVPVASAEVTMLPASTVAVSGQNAQTLLKLLEALEDNDDVQNVWANFDISDEAMEAFG